MSALQETVTIINNSGKIISTGKQLFGIFKEAKACYNEKKSFIHHERSLQRSQTFDVGAQPSYHHQPQQYHDYDYGENPYYAGDDGRSHVSHRSHRSHRSSASRRHGPSASRAAPALTEANLRSHSEVSATPPPPPPHYRSPYAETAPRDMTLSRPTLARAPTELAPARTDLDPDHPDTQHARTLIGRVETLLDEANCVQHSATGIISHLQRNPDAAAAVALTLAELSTLLAKVSPSFLGIVQGGSPAVFALLSSPQFLIAAGAAVGVTVVMFGGWKIIKRIKENKAQEAMQREAMAFQASQIPMQPMGHMAPPMDPMHYDMMGMPMREPEYYPEEHPIVGDGVDEALVIEQELSGIESWRRGIVPFGEDESVDVELISPEAQRAVKRGAKEHRRRHHSDGEYEDDGVSRSGRSERSERSTRSHRSHRSTRSHRPRDPEIPDRKSSRSGTTVVAPSERGRDHDRDTRSEAGSERSHRSTRSKRTVKTIEAKKDDDPNSLDLVLRPKEKKGSNMLKQLFKKKKDKEEASSRAVSVLV
ncbi:unnamed protein product [Parascedosporium putredinis]|uniref:Uncharacterized protein n=1 Tax=Parascedosporium putredinis TaxID=1442378 RepID=A0A9P1H600_9PEZI|nr:unnamed protein product [Parascedosporium putredinis]CAI7999788.1 unnamed protein product [Parascedosporium putredinis]